MATKQILQTERFLDVLKATAALSRARVPFVHTEFPTGDGAEPAVHVIEVDATLVAVAERTLDEAGVRAAWFPERE